MTVNGAAGLPCVQTGIHRLSRCTEAPRYGREPAPRAARASAPPAAPFRLPSNSCWCSCPLEPRNGRETGHGGRVRVTHNTRRVRVYGRAGWLIIGSRTARGGTPRQQVEAQRYRSSGRHDVSGCLRPCLIAYYDLCFLGTDSRMAAGLFEWWGLGVPCWRRYLCCASRRIEFAARASRGRELGLRKCLQVLYSCQG